MPDLRRDVRQGAAAIVGGPRFLVVLLGLPDDIQQFLPVHPWFLEEQGLLIDHMFQQFVLIEDHVHVTVKQEHPDGQELATISHVELELADVSHVCYRLQRRLQVAQSQRMERRLVKPRRRPARAGVAAQPATRAELAHSV